MLVAPTPADTHGGYLLRTRTFLLPLRATLFSLAACGLWRDPPHGPAAFLQDRAL